MRTAAFLVAAAASVAHAQTPELAEKLCRAVVLVQTSDRNVERAQALRQQRAPVQSFRQLTIHQPYTMVVSGVCISPREILTTALHPRADLRVIVSYHDGRVETEARVVGTDPLSNLALLETPTDAPGFVEIGTAPVAPDATLSLAGFQTECSKRTPALLAGRIGSAHLPLRLRDMYGVTGTGVIVLGTAFAIGTFDGDPNVGAACVDDEGRLVGLVVGGMPLRLVPDPDREGRMRTLAMRFAIPAARIARVVDDFRREGRVVRASFGLRLEPVDAALGAQFDLPPSACSIGLTDPGGPAARAGLALHDVVLSVDGATYRDMYELGEALTEKPPGAPVSIEVLRKGRRLTVEATPVDQR